LPVLARSGFVHNEGHAHPWYSYHKEERSGILRENKSLLKTIWGWVYPIVLGVVIAFALERWVVTPASVPTQSMNPNIPAPCYVLVNRLSTEFGNPYRGEVVLFRFPDNPSVTYVKRIIGMPGDTVTVAENAVYINGVKLNEPYLDVPNGTALGTYHVPAGHYFMLGDNRPISDDSRLWVHKYVARSAIEGQAIFVIFPFQKMGKIVQ
jgi:signal peptidase I